MPTTKQIDKIAVDNARVYEWAFNEKQPVSLSYHAPSVFTLQFPVPEAVKNENREFQGAIFQSSNFNEVLAFSDWMKRIEVVKVASVKFSRPGRPKGTTKAVLEAKKAAKEAEVLTEESKAPAKGKDSQKPKKGKK